MRHAFRASIALALFATASNAADDPVFSGPQVGEKLTAFTMRGVFDDSAGKPIDLVTLAGGKPTLLVFVHEANRPSIAVTRSLMDYAAKRHKDGLVSGVVWLADDATGAEQFLKRARHAMPQSVPIGISIDGKEGPDAYGLNRNVTLTVLIARDNVVTANYALVQPSVQADVPKVLGDLVKLIGGKAPTVAELDAMVRPQAAARKTAAREDETDPNLAAKVRAVIQKTAEPATVDRAAAAVESYVAENKAAREQLGRLTRRIIDADRLDTYGTPRAREYLRKWSEKYGPETKSKETPTATDRPGGKP